MMYIPNWRCRCRLPELTDEELDIYTRLNQVSEDFSRLPRILLRDTDDFEFHVQALKNIIAFRPVMRDLLARRGVTIRPIGGTYGRTSKRPNP